jgi:hypothetical protein
VLTSAIFIADLLAFLEVETETSEASLSSTTAESTLSLEVCDVFPFFEPALLFEAEWSTAAASLSCDFLDGVGPAAGTVLFAFEVVGSAFALFTLL